MAQVKMMDEPAFERLLKEVNSQGELIRARQDEKQSLLNEFDKERERFISGKISRATLSSSVTKTNTELIKLDANIRTAMREALRLSKQADTILNRQEPKVFRVSESGAKLEDGKKKPAAKKKSPSKKSVTRKSLVKKSVAEKKIVPSKTTLLKEKVLDRKYSEK